MPRSTTPPGPAPASSTCSTARPALLRPAIANPHPAVRPGSARRSRPSGPNVLIGSPHDDTAGPGAGAAFLFDGATGLAAQVVRPARRRRRPLRRIGRGHRHDGLDRRPRRDARRTADAGAAYLFDADPSSPTFGTADRRRAGAHAQSPATPSAPRSASSTSRPWSIGAASRRARALPGPRPPTSTSRASPEPLRQRRPTPRPTVRFGDPQRHVHGPGHSCTLTAIDRLGRRLAADRGHAARPDPTPSRSRTTTPTTRSPATRSASPLTDHHGRVPPFAQTCRRHQRPGAGLRRPGPGALVSRASTRTTRSPSAGRS